MLHSKFSSFSIFFIVLAGFDLSMLNINSSMRSVGISVAILMFNLPFASTWEKILRFWAGCDKLLVAYIRENIIVR